MNSPLANAFAGIIIGMALLIIVINGNSNQLVQLAKRDKDFMLWIGAIIVLFALERYKLISGPVEMLVTVGLIGLGITRGPVIAANAKKAFASFG